MAFGSSRKAHAGSRYGSHDNAKFFLAEAKKDLRKGNCAQAVANLADANMFLGRFSVHNEAANDNEYKGEGRRLFNESQKIMRAIFRKCRLGRYESRY